MNDIQQLSLKNDMVSKANNLFSTAVDISKGDRQKVIFCLSVAILTLNAQIQALSVKKPAAKPATEKKKAKKK